MFFIHVFEFGTRQRRKERRKVLSLPNSRLFYVSEYRELPREVARRDRLVAAVAIRLRAIAMTTLAAILALLLLALAISEGSAMQQLLAIAIVSGLAVQLPLVLILMPALIARVPLLACPAVPNLLGTHCWTSQQWHPFPKLATSCFIDLPQTALLVERLVVGLRDRVVDSWRRSVAAPILARFV